MKAIWLEKLSQEKNITAAFRYSFIPSDSSSIKIAAASLYRIFVNGKFIGYGPARAAHLYSRVDSYSLAEYAGKKAVIALEVFASNINSFYVIDEPPFFACEITENGKVIAQAEDFEAFRFAGRLQRVRRFSFQRSFTEIYRLAKNPADFYTGGEDGDFIRYKTQDVAMNKLLNRYVSYPTLRKVEASKCIECGELGYNAKAGEWRDRAYYNIDETKLKGYRGDEIEEDSGGEVSHFTYKRSEYGNNNPIMKENSYRLYDFSRTLTGFFSLSLDVIKDCKLYITFDEVITDESDHIHVDPFRNACVNVVKYTLKAGHYDLISFEANSARFADICVTDGEAKIDSFGIILYENPDVNNFAYDYADTELNAIVDAAKNTLAQNALDVLTDCPSRERAGWLCDSYFSSRAEYLFTGKNLVERSFLENYALCPQSPYLPSGMLPMCYPSDHNDGVYIPNWTMWYILELSNYVNRTGDKNMLEISKDKVYGLVDFFKKYYNEYGLLENLESWVFIEWSRCNDNDFICGVNYPSNMIWSAALHAVGEMYGDEALIKQSDEMKRAIRSLSFNGEFFEDNGIRDEKGRLTKTGHTSETAQYYAFYFDVASKEEYSELWNLMLTKFGPSRDDSVVYPDVFRSNAIVGNYLRLELLIRFGYKAQVLDECRAFFTKMAKTTGTLWEHSGLSGSLNHGFASMAAVYINECAENRIKN